MDNTILSTAHGVRDDCEGQSPVHERVNTGDLGYNQFKAVQAKMDLQQYSLTTLQPMQVFKATPHTFTYVYRDQTARPLYYKVHRDRYWYCVIAVKIADVGCPIIIISQLD